MPGERQTYVEEEEERKKIELKIEVEDFGPISGGEITLKPLTVFIGPNNSGKSYAAMLTCSIFESYTPTSSSSFLTHIVDASLRKFPELKRRFDGLKEGEELDIPRQFTEAITQKVLEEIYQKRLSDEIVRSFACPLDELIRIGKSSFVLEISHDSRNIRLICQENELKVGQYPRLDISVRIKEVAQFGYVIGYTPGPGEKEEEFFMETIVSQEKGKARRSFSGLIVLISNLCAARLLKDVAVQCRYLPAARSSILQVSKALLVSIIKQTPYIGMEKLEIPTLSGVVSDSISSMIGLPEEKGSFYQLARDFEEELIQGEIIRAGPSGHLYPEIRYRFQGTDIPLHRSSSAVSELAPLFLYLKYIIEPNSILVIEEPEAHLHPGNQRILARLLVRLVREGVSIIITTHSEYLLEQLRNFILLSKVEPKKRVKKYQYSEEDFLKPDEFAAYVFHYDTESAGHRIDEVEITEDGEISDEEFAKVYEALYDETIKLRIDLSDET